MPDLHYHLQWTSTAHSLAALYPTENTQQSGLSPIIATCEHPTVIPTVGCSSNILGGVCLGKDYILTIQYILNTQAAGTASPWISSSNSGNKVCSNTNWTLNSFLNSAPARALTKSRQAKQRLSYTFLETLGSLIIMTPAIMIPIRKVTLMSRSRSQAVSHSEYKTKQIWLLNNSKIFQKHTFFILCLKDFTTLWMSSSKVFQKCIGCPKNVWMALRAQKWLEYWLMAQSKENTIYLGKMGPFMFYKRFLETYSSFTFRHSK